MKKKDLRRIIREEIKALISSNSKLINEGYAWERTPGRPLPTLNDTSRAYANNKRLTEAGKPEHKEFIKARNMVTAANHAMESYLKSSMVAHSLTDDWVNTSSKSERLFKDIEKLIKAGRQ